MEQKFEFLWTKELERQYKSYRKDKKTLKKIDETILSILENPFEQSLGDVILYIIRRSQLY